MTDNRPRTRTAVVTGASRGLGAVIARRLAADGSAVALRHSYHRQRRVDLVGGTRGE